MPWLVPLVPMAVLATPAVSATSVYGLQLAGVEDGHDDDVASSGASSTAKKNARTQQRAPRIGDRKQVGVGNCKFTLCRTLSLPRFVRVNTIKKPIAS